MTPLQAVAQERARLREEVVKKAYKPWDHYHDIEGETEVVNLADVLALLRE